MTNVADERAAVTYEGAMRVWTSEREEWCIATTAEGAGNAYEKEFGFRLGQEGEPAAAFGAMEAIWTEEPPGKVFRYTPDDGETWESRTCAEWAVRQPPGYFASSNV